MLISMDFIIDDFKTLLQNEKENHSKTMIKAVKLLRKGFHMLSELPLANVSEEWCKLLEYLDDMVESLETLKMCFEEEV